MASTIRQVLPVESSPAACALLTSSPSCCISLSCGPDMPSNEGMSVTGASHSCPDCLCIVYQIEKRFRVYMEAPGFHPGSGVIVDHHTLDASSFLPGRPFSNYVRKDLRISVSGRQHKGQRRGSSSYADVWGTKLRKRTTSVCTEDRVRVKRFGFRVWVAVRLGSATVCMPREATSCHLF